MTKTFRMKSRGAVNVRSALGIYISNLRDAQKKKKKKIASLKVPSHKKRVLAAFFLSYRLGVEKTSNTKAYSVSRGDSKNDRRFFFFLFFHSTLPSSHNTQAQKHTVTHQRTHTHSLLSLNSCGEMSGSLLMIVFSVSSGHASAYGHSYSVVFRLDNAC